MNDKKGFTLIELTFVLVIIALIIGGILAGQQMVANMKVKKVITEIKNYQSAITLFYETYDGYPGDLPDAFDYWGTNCGTDAAAPTGCNGDGNELIDYGAGTLPLEGARAWQHLELANMIQTAGMSGTFATDSIGVPGINMPKSLLKGAGYWFNNNSTLGNYIGIGILEVADEPDGLILSPYQAYKIDNKFDDGIPNSGRVRGFPMGSGSNACTPNGVANAYDITGKGRKCYMYIKLTSGQK